MEKGTFVANTGLAQMLKDGVIMDVVTPKQSPYVILNSFQNLTPKNHSFENKPPRLALEHPLQGDLS